MSEELQQKLRSQLWTVANTLRGNMSASDFMYFTLGFIFYKYLSEKIELYANEILEEDHITFKEVWNGKDERTARHQQLYLLCGGEEQRFFEQQGGARVGQYCK